MKMNLSKLKNNKTYTCFSLILCNLCFILLFSCSKEKIDSTSSLDYSYFPYTKGFKVQFDVDSTIWDDFTGQMYFSQSQILEIYESYFIDASGNQTLRIERYQRKNENDEWKILKIYTANLNKTRAEITEDNIRLIKLIFPTEKNKTWDGNAFNSLKPETWRITEVHKALQINSNNFDSTLTVLHSNETNLINEDIRYEIYATHVGLIKKYEKTVTKNIATQEIVKGKLIIQTIKSIDHITK